MLCTIAVLLVAFASDVAKRPLVEFRGNVLFDELLYRSVLDLPKSARATPAEAQAVSAKLQGFLRRAGCDLAVVRARARAAVRVAHHRHVQPVVAGVRARFLDQLARRPRRWRALS
jgi:hypothetical protein